MRDRIYRILAAVLGFLGILSLAFQVYREWPPEPWRLGYYASQALIAGIFLAYGQGLWLSHDAKPPASIQDVPSLAD